MLGRVAIAPDCRSGGKPSEVRVLQHPPVSRLQGYRPVLSVEEIYLYGEKPNYSPCRSGGTGIHVRLRSVCLRACGFNSHLRYLWAFSSARESACFAIRRSLVQIQ